MKATIEVPDELYRRVKARSALEGRPIRAVVTQLLAEWLEGRRPSPPPEGAGTAKGTTAHPAWFGSLRKYAHPEISHDMDDVRRSIERAHGKRFEGSGKP